QLPDEKLGIVLGDVSGKGISASLFMAKLTSDLQYYALLHQEPGQLLSKINNLLCKRAKRGMFVTLVYILLDTKKKQILFANGGHLSPIYVDKDDIIQLGQDSTKGPPLGVIPDVEFMQEEFELKKGGSVTLYTDGIIEAKNSIGELYGIERLLSAIKTLSNTPDTLISGIINSVDKFVEGEGPSDDLTLLSFRSK
ncbi:MAG: serine/threonine-protein phosphatase, partial [Desulfobacula sp.]|nr:serine/threonine-protein phosphatase [Desulfobacula sp.]